MSKRNIFAQNKIDAEKKYLNMKLAEWKLYRKLQNPIF